MSRCSIVALPYISATQSGVVALAQAFDRPVIATRVGGLEEMVLHGRTGILVRPGDPVAFARALRGLAMDAPRRAKDAAGDPQGGKRQVGSSGGRRDVCPRLLECRARQEVHVSSPPRHDSISVVIGSFNAAAWLGKTLESVLSQTHPVDEVIVVDDGSTDQTVEIAESYGSKIRFIQEEHRGRPHRNRGIEASSSALIAFIDADDYWHPTKLERQLVRMHAQRTEWVVCDAEWLDSVTGRTFAAVGMTLREGDILEALFEKNFIVASTPIVSRRVLEGVGAFDESPDLAPVEDWDLWLRIAARYPLACERERLATLRLHGDSFLASTPLSRRVLSIENVVARAYAREPVRLGPLRRVRAAQFLFRGRRRGLSSTSRIGGSRFFFQGLAAATRRLSRPGVCGTQLGAPAERRTPSRTYAADGAWSPNQVAEMTAYLTTSAEQSSRHDCTH